MRVPSAALAVAVACGGAAAQGPAPSLATLCNPRSNPYDAVTAAPCSHSVLFEDEHVRVLEVIIPPLAAEPIHIHALPSVMMGETGGGAGARFLYTEYRFKGGKFVEVKKNEVTPAAGFRTVWSAPEGPHSIANLGSTVMRLTRTEIKPEACAR